MASAPVPTTTTVFAGVTLLPAPTDHVQLGEAAEHLAEVARLAVAEQHVGEQGAAELAGVAGLRQRQPDRLRRAGGQGVDVAPRRWSV